uniref:asparagine synthase (glutamine-hydrolyzing) n=1 Tax=Sphingomonas daechungensis TaxID=1176646 RepID=UPI0037848D24
MCGIAGHIDFAGDRSAANNERLAQAMSDALWHRGPDSAGVAEPIRGTWFAFRRLAILDTSEAGNQPMFTPDRLGCIVFNGEGYNAAELRAELEGAGYRFRGHSDTEAILYGCRHWGVEDTVRRLTGMFAFAYVDLRSRTLTLARDRLGKKPLYWFKTERAFAFASELKALVRHPSCPREIDRASIAEFLRYLYVPAPHTIYTGVSKLEPGQILDLSLEDRSITATSYWTLREAVQRAKLDPFRGTPSEAVEEAEALLRDATRDRLISDVPLGAFLSGGVDSSTIVALMQELASGPVRTFSIGYSNKEYDESADAERIAAHLGTDHTTFRVEPDDAMAV